MTGSFPEEPAAPQEVGPALQSHPKVLRPVCLFGTRWTRSTHHEEQPLCQGNAPAPYLQIGCAGTHVASHPAARLQNAHGHETGAGEEPHPAGGGAVHLTKVLRKMSHPLAS